MRFKLNLMLIAGLCGLALLLMGVSCNGTNGTTARSGAGGGTPEEGAPMADGTAPGIDFQKVTPGLPATTLDYITSEPVALAGAGAGARVFFGIKDGATTRLYSRDLNDGNRAYLGERNHLVAGSLVTDAAGDKLAYCRLREIENYIEDPYYKFPDRLSLVYLTDVASGETTEVFDFRDNPWRAYRSDNLMPYISPDGSTVYVLAYNLDWLYLDSQLKEWLAIDADYVENGADLTEEDRAGTEEALRTLLVARHVRPLLEELGVEVADEGPVSEAERQGVKDLEREAGIPEAALLIWAEGETRLLPLKVDQDKRHAYHYIIAADADTVLLVAPEQFADQAAPQPVYSVDLESGEVTECCSYTGAPSNYLLDAGGDNLVITYNPIDAGAREVLTQTNLQVIPLDGSAPTDYPLGGDYIGMSSVSSDHKTFVGQDKDNYDLYAVDVHSGERRLLKKLLAEVESMFLAEDGKHMVYSDSGVLFELPVPADPATDPAWVSEDHAVEYKPAVLEFFTTAGFTVPADATFEWEERSGIGEHELAVEMRNPADPSTVALVRYQIETGSVVSAFFPRGYPFPIDGELAGEDLDYYAVEEIAVKLMDRLGWLDPETRSVYQPGPNPLYDAHSDSFFVAYRDGYWLGEGEGARWVYNGETTMRIRASDGLVIEMSVSNLPEIRKQELSLPLERTKMIIRNKENRPLPDTDAIRFDLENVRYVVHQRRLDHWTSAGYEIALVPRLCYEIDTYIMPEDELVLTTRVDATSGDILGEIEFMPTNINY